MLVSELVFEVLEAERDAVTGCLRHLAEGRVVGREEVLHAAADNRAVYAREAEVVEVSGKRGEAGDLQVEQHHLQGRSQVVIPVRSRMPP